MRHFKLPQRFIRDLHSYATIRSVVSVPPANVKQSKTIKHGTDRLCQKSVNNYQFTLRYIPDERRFQTYIESCTCVID